MPWPPARHRNARNPSVTRYARFAAARRPVSCHHPVLEVGDAGRLDGPDLLELHLRVPEVVEETSTVAEQHRNKMELSSSSSPAARYCRATSAPPQSMTSLPPAASLACSSADSIPSVTKWNVVPPSISRGSRGWRVRMNTAWW